MSSVDRRSTSFSSRLDCSEFCLFDVLSLLSLFEKQVLVLDLSQEAFPTLTFLLIRHLLKEIFVFFRFCVDLDFCFYFSAAPENLATA